MAASSPVARPSIRRFAPPQDEGPRVSKTVGRRAQWLYCAISKRFSIGATSPDGAMRFAYCARLAVIASEAKQSRAKGVTDRDCFVAFGSSQ
jgi:hypothetical protein